MDLLKRECKWIRPVKDYGDVAVVFKKQIVLNRNACDITDAFLTVSATGVYEARINNKRVGNFIMAPGWTSYKSRLQAQDYNVTKDIYRKTKFENDISELTITVSKGWYRSPLPGWISDEERKAAAKEFPSCIAMLFIKYQSGHIQVIRTDDTWTVGEGPVRYAEIYGGEIYDATFESKPGNTNLGSVISKSGNQETDPLPTCENTVIVCNGPTDTLIKQEGAYVTEHEHFIPTKITTPKGEVVFDFGQNLTGYVELSLEAERGERVRLSFAEVLDDEGNFYTDNYRGAKCLYDYTCREGKQKYKPQFTFYGFRYIRIDEFPKGTNNATTDNFTAIALYSDMKRTGYVRSSSSILNQLFHNIVWGQNSNFLDIPTDCPQRDERLGWTGDAQVFIRTACLNYDAERFFMKWLRDMASEQGQNGFISHVVPLPRFEWTEASAAWGDAICICPMELYQAYGNREFLDYMFSHMCKWIDYITQVTTTSNLWTGGTHYGDWLGLDSPAGSYKGATREEFIASAFYAHSTQLVIEAGHILNHDVSKYEQLHTDIVNTFRATYTDYRTQTECVLAAHFGLAPDCRKAADQLAQMITDNKTSLATGFVGTPYILHVLSSYGYTDIAYSLLLREQYPSWLYPVTKGATTMWEHWDGIQPNGKFWSADMNSFNHYAYGSVADWIYQVALGIRPLTPGYETIIIEPHADKRLEWLESEYMSRHGLIRSFWCRENDGFRYEIETPVEATVIIDGKTYHMRPGKQVFHEM